MSKKMFLEADPKQVSIKSLLGKDFLELSMRTVSSANPNRNGSWFTEEAQRKALPSYDDKPILADFANGDFISHEGDWKHDPDTGMDFWDTLGQRGERPLGVIRGSDRKEVVLDEKTGLYWTEITCVLWTQYSYRQVKRLIEDAIAAAESGGPTKNISVEVDITDYEELPNGVLKINDYNLCGVTILGSRNGKKVEPGIEGAQLSVLDVISKGLYERQRHSLMQAYEALDESLSHKEGTMTEEEKKALSAEGEPAPAAQPEAFESEQPKGGESEPKKENEAEQPKEGAPEAKKENESLGVDPEEEEKKVTKTDVVCDLAWMIENLSYRIESYDNCIKHYEEAEIPGKGLIIATLKRMKACAEEQISELGKLLALVSADDFAEDAEREEFECKLAEHCSLPEVYKQLQEAECKFAEVNCKLEEKEKECNELKESCAKQEDECKLCKHELEEVRAEKENLQFSVFMEKARAAVEGASEAIGDEAAQSILSRCESKEIFSAEALDNEIALAVGKAALANKVAKKAYSAPIPTFTMPGDAKEAEAKSSDPFVRMGYKAKK